LNDAYNANADSMAAALKTFAEMRVAGRRVAVLGDMGELGDHTASAHEEVGRLAAASKVQLLVAVGANAHLTASAAMQAGLGDVVAVAGVDEAIAELRAKLRPKDLVLLKASRSAKLERLVALLREPAAQTEVRG
jgi:UDP-N-acetylmuramoyl-tripeptide--D-alanyl-D-alanine ligase